MNNLIDALLHVNFLAIAILELFGLVCFFFFRHFLRIRRKLFWGLIVLFLYFISWRLLLGISGRRYYVMTIFATFPFALVPLMIDWKRMNWSPRWKRAGKFFFLVGTLTVLGICFGRNLMPEKRSPVIAEFATTLRKSFHRVPAKGPIVLLDNTTRGGQIMEEADSEWRLCWVPSYKAEIQCGSAIKHIRESVLPGGGLKSYGEIIFFCRTQEREALNELTNKVFPKFNFTLVEQHESNLQRNYFLFRFQRSNDSLP